jgi:hypothetical protein
MASGDSLHDLLAAVRLDMPDVPAEVWDRFAVLASLKYGASRIYVPAQRKRRHLEALAAADGDADAEHMARLLGVSVRHLRRLRALSR